MVSIAHAHPILHPYLAPPETLTKPKVTIHFYNENRIKKLPIHTDVIIINLTKETLTNPPKLMFIFIDFVEYRNDNITAAISKVVKILAATLPFLSYITLTPAEIHKIQIVYMKLVIL